MIAATLLGLCATGLPFLLRRVRGNSSLAMAILFVALVRQLASLGQVHLDGLPTVDRDPIVFHRQAAGQYGPLYRTQYGQSLSLVYSLFGDEHILGCELSQFAFALALIVFIDLISFFKLDDHAGKIVLLFGLLPSCVLNTSVTLREPFQVLAFLTLCLAALRSARDGPGTITLLLPASAGMLIFLHQGFSLLALILLPLAIVWIARDQPSVLFVAALIGGVPLVLAGGKVWNLIARDSAVLQNIERGTAVEYLDNYQEGVKQGRSTFNTLLDASSVSGVVSTAPIVAANYLFSPFPWQARGAKDLYGMIESAIRLFLFFHAIAYVRKRYGLPRRYRVLTLLLFLLVELMWAAGTANWGTAFRHRVVGWGLLVLLGAANLASRPEKVYENAPVLGAKKRHGAGSLRSQIRERRRRLPGGKRMVDSGRDSQAGRNKLRRKSPKATPKK